MGHYNDQFHMSVAPSTHEIFKEIAKLASHQKNFLQILRIEGNHTLFKDECFIRMQYILISAFILLFLPFLSSLLYNLS